MIFDEHVIVSIAFFVCIFVIFAKFGKKISSAIKKQRTSICSLIDAKEIELSTSKNNLKAQIERRKEIFAQISELNEHSEKEASYILQTAANKAKDLIEYQTSSREKLNNQIKEHILNQFRLIAIEASLSSIQDFFETKTNEEKFQNELLDSILDECHQ